MRKKQPVIEVNTPKRAAAALLLAKLDDLTAEEIRGLTASEGSPFEGYRLSAVRVEKINDQLEKITAAFRTKLERILGLT